MEKGYKQIVYFFGIIAVVTFVGFFKKYFSLAPGFPGVKAVHHFHALLLSTWLILLIVQPILIANKKTHIHKILGRFSYILVPMAFVSMLMAYHSQYHNFIAEGKPESFTLGFVFAPATDAIPFVILYLLAIINRRNTAIHMRYMITTGIVVGGPGLGRVFMTWLNMDLFIAIQFLTLIQLLTFVGLIVYDKVSKKKFAHNPYTTALIIWLVPNVLIIFFPSTGMWQSFAKWLTTIV